MTRDQRLMTVFTALTVVAVGVVWTSIGLQDPPPPAAVLREVPTGDDGRVTVEFVGDTMIGDELQLLIDQQQRGNDWPFDAVRPALAGDFTIANAESPISERTAPWNPAKEFSHSSRPDVAEALARAGVDAGTLANNHAFDVGPEGLADTMRRLDEVGISSVGAGSDLARAEQPLLLSTRFGTIGVVSIGESYGHRATDDEAGTLVISRETVRRGYALARAAGADWVVAAVHWGDNYAPVNDVQRYFAREFADAGYELVIGTGSHTAQVIEYIGRMPVIYSLGNFVFGTPGRFAEHNAAGFGLSAELALSHGGAPQIALRCIVTDNRVVNFQPRMCTAAEAQAVLPALHPAVTLRDDVGVLPCTGCFARTDAETDR